MSEAAFPINAALPNENILPGTTQPASLDRTGGASADIWKQLRLPYYKRDHPPVANANAVFEKGVSPLDKLAVAITDRVGSMAFFLTILAWTVLWCGYNIVASQVHALHWKAFDPFPAFVAYLLISNVIQILLMPLIMVGQNVQGRHSEIRAEQELRVLGSEHLLAEKLEAIP